MFRDKFLIFGLTRTKIFLLMAVSMTAAILEGFGMAMFLPLFQYIEKGRNIDVLLSDSKMWQYLIQFFNFLKIEITFVSLLVSVLIILLLRVVFMFVRQVYTSWLTQDILHTTRTNLLKAYLESNNEYYSSLSSGKVVNILTTETQRVGGGCNAVFALAANAVVIICFIAVLFWLSAVMTMVAVLFLSLTGLLINYYVRHTKRLSHNTTDSNSRFSFQLLECLTAFRLLKITATTEREFNRVSKASEKVRDNYYWLSKLNARIDLLLEPIVIFCGLGIFYLAINNFKMSIAQVGLFLLVLLRLLPLCKEFLRSRQSFFAFNGSFKIVRGSYDDAMRNKEEDDGNKTFVGRLTKGIRMENLSFSYSGQADPALQDINIFIPAGKMTALVGSSGAGKTTLVDLLPRLKIPQSGVIFFDDEPAQTYKLSSLRKAIAFVSQDITILNDSVKTNVAFAKNDASEEEIIEALRKSKSLDFVQSLSQGMNTIIGERGSRLSGGQKQRLSLARAFLQKSPILILDEPTSALDSEVEEDIQEAITELRKEGGVTIIVIAHRFSTIREADKIIVLRDGKVVEEGTHRELVISQEWYSKICDLQNKKLENN